MSELKTVINIQIAAVKSGKPRLVIIAWPLNSEVFSGPVLFVDMGHLPAFAPTFAAVTRPYLAAMIAEPFDCNARALCVLLHEFVSRHWGKPRLLSIRLEVHETVNGLL